MILALLAGGCVPAVGPQGAALMAGNPIEAQIEARAGLVRSCDVRGRALGREVAQAPAEGRARLKLHDTAPEAVAPRPQHVTGFSDGCPRQVNAALVMFGNPSVHEALRHGTESEGPWRTLDDAYVRIRRAACGVGPEAPCPDARLPELERRASFVTVYPEFGGFGSVTLLLDDGRAVAVAQD